MSIVEIAKQAGVSISTVSRYFNQPDKVSHDAAGRIRAVTTRLNYHPDIRRPGPKTSERIGIKTGTIAFLSLGNFSPEEMLQMPAFPVLLGSIQRTLIERQLSLLLAHLESESGNIPGCIDPRSCDGVILFGKADCPELKEKLIRKLGGLPAVWCFREHSDDERRFDHILYDNRAVGNIAAEYLAGHGHKSVAVFNADPTHGAFAVRVPTFRKRSVELGMSVREFATGPAGNPIDRYRKLAEEFRRECCGVTGAFFCSDDIMLGVCNELRALGMSVDELDCIGCNADEVLLRYFSPRPATIDIKMAEVGEMAVLHLLRRINSECGSYCSEIFIRPELVKGDR